MKHYATFIIAILITVSANSQDDQSDMESHTVDPAAIIQKSGYDREPFAAKRFDEKKWRKIVGNESYSEVPKIRKAKRNLQDSTESESRNGDTRFKPQDRDEPEDFEFYGSVPINSGILKIFVYAIAFGIIAFILVAILKNISVKSNRRVPKAESPDVAGSVAEIRELEIDRHLREALASGNYRLAIRTYFLGLLKKLDENGSIVWKKDKTNRDYLTELFAKVSYFEDVKGLTLAYERVWYGGHDLPVQSYEEIISAFKAMDGKIKTSTDK